MSSSTRETTMSDKKEEKLYKPESLRLTCAKQMVYTLDKNEKQELLRELTIAMNPEEPFHGIAGTSRQIVKDTVYSYQMFDLSTSQRPDLWQLMEETEDRPVLPHYIVSCMLDFAEGDSLYGLSNFRTMMEECLTRYLDRHYIDLTYEVVLSTPAVKDYHERTKIMYGRFEELYPCFPEGFDEPIDLIKLCKIPFFADIGADDIPDYDRFRSKIHHTIRWRIEEYLGKDILPKEE